VEAVKWLLQAAEQNEPKAQRELGICYHLGRGVVKDDAEAVKWYRKAAEQNHAEAQDNLGTCYYAGLGVTKDQAEAVKWWLRAADQNDAGAQYNLGVYYFNGQGVSKDQSKAVDWYRQAAGQGLAAAQHGLSICYAYGSGVIRDDVEAVKWARKAAEQNLHPRRATSEFTTPMAAASARMKSRREMVSQSRRAERRQGASESWTLLCDGQRYREGRDGSLPMVFSGGGTSFTAARNNLAKLEGILSQERIAEGKRRVDDWLEHRRAPSR